jgi:hypothetical protein
MTHGIRALKDEEYIKLIYRLLLFIRRINPQQIIKKIFLFISILTNNRRTNNNRELLNKTLATVDRLLFSILRMELP